MYDEYQFLKNLIIISLFLENLVKNYVRMKNINQYF